MAASEAAPGEVPHLERKRVARARAGHQSEGLQDAADLIERSTDAPLSWARAPAR